MEKKLMVNFSTIAIIGGLGLLIFFKKDVGSFLNQFKGFGSEFGKDFGKIPDITINIPDFGLPEAGAVIAGGASQIGGELGKIGENINQFGIDVQTNIQTALDEAGKGIDQSIKDTQAGFEQFGQDVQTNIGNIGTGITEFVGGLFPAPKTTVSETTPSIVTTSRRTGTATRFGGQTAPKEILTQTTATGTGTTTDPFKAQQPDPSLVSPFLTQFQKDPITEPTLTTSRRTGTTGGR